MQEKKFDQIDIKEAEKRGYDRGYHKAQKGEPYNAGRRQGLHDAKRDIMLFLRDGHRGSRGKWFKKYLNKMGYDLIKIEEIGE